MAQPPSRPATRSALGRATRLDIGALLDVDRVLASLRHIVDHESDQGAVAVLVVRPDLTGALFDSDADFITWADAFHRRLADADPRLRLAFRSAEEAVGFVPGLSSRAEIAPLVNRLGAALDGSLDLGDGSIAVDSRAGVAAVESGGADAAVEAAGLALLRTSTDRRARLFTPFQRLRRARDEHLEAAVRNDLADGSVMVRYQPMVDLRTAEVRGVEALARMRDGVRGELAPGVFLPVASRHGLMPDVGAAVLGRVTEDVQRWRSTATTPLTVWVNLSVLDVLADDTFGPITELADDEDGVSLGVELTDTARADVADLRAAADRLHRHGLAGAVDYHALPFTELARNRFHTVKLNRRVVRHIAARSAPAVASLVALLHQFDLAVTADGIETEAHLRPVVRAGCDQGQGFYFARPVEAAVIDDLVVTGDGQPSTPAASRAATSSGV